MTALYLAGMIAGPVSGAILSYFDGAAGLSGWQWLFLVEGLPSSVLGFVALRFLDDRPDDARWLSDADKAALRAAHTQAEAGTPEANMARPLLAQRDFWLLCAANFAIAAAGYALVFWMPVILHRGGLHGAMQIGLLSALPYLCGIVGMLGMGWRTERRREWRGHGAIAMIACAAALAGLARVTGTTHMMIALCVAVATHAAALPAFWVLPGRAAEALDGGRDRGDHDVRRDRRIRESVPDGRAQHGHRVDARRTLFQRRAARSRRHRVAFHAAHPRIVSSGRELTASAVPPSLSSTLMNFDLELDHRMIRDLVARFVKDELIPLEAAVMAREADGQRFGLLDDERAHLDERSRQLGLSTRRSRQAAPTCRPSRWSA